MESRRWLISRRADFWFASAGAAGGLLAALAVIRFYGDRQLDWLDLVLSELHLGATYDAIVRRRLWRERRTDVLIIPLLILAATSFLIATNHWVFLTSIGMYAAVWHRGRQNFGVARFYQRLAGVPPSAAHGRFFHAAIYAPMAAAVLLYSHMSPQEIEGSPYFALNTGAAIAWLSGAVALVCVAAYFLWALTGNRRSLHPGESWIVLSHAVAFGSAYVFGAANASYLFVLTVHHEVQYLYFTYAMARWPMRAGQTQSFPVESGASELRFAASFAVLPVIGLAGAVGTNWYASPWLAPLGIGGLFCHYWLDGRIWVRR